LITGETTPVISNDVTSRIHSRNFLMKKTIGARVLIAVLASCFSCCALADTEEDVIKSMSYNPKIKLVHKLAAFDGLLLGFDGGEWGGALIFLGKQGRATKVYDSNIRGIVTAGHRILVFSGLAHMGSNEGKIVELNQVASDPPSARELVVLEGGVGCAPSGRADRSLPGFHRLRSRRQDDLRLQVVRQRFRFQFDWLYDCRLLALTRLRLLGIVGFKSSPVLRESP
jgi:hypothetical protein